MVWLSARYQCVRIGSESESETEPDSELGAQGQLPPIKIAVKTHYNKGASERARHREDNQPEKETN